MQTIEGCVRMSVKIHRRLLPLYNALEEAALKVEPYLALNTSREGWIKMRGASDCIVYLPLGTQIDISEERFTGDDGTYYVWVKKRNCILQPKWNKFICPDRHLAHGCVFDFDTVKDCMSLVNDLCKAETQLIEHIAPLVTTVLGVLARRDRCLPLEKRLSKDIRRMIGALILEGEMRVAKEKVAEWR